MRDWGVDSATWAVRALLVDAGLRGPDGGPPSESLTFIVAGGIGFGSVVAPAGSPVCWFVSGRHAWHGDWPYIRQACERIGLEVAHFESDDPALSELILAQWLAHETPCVLAWVDAAVLPWHSLPTQWRSLDQWRGLSPRVVVLRGTALNGVLVDDLRSTPRLLSSAHLQEARASLPRHHCRLLRLAEGTQFVDMGGAIKRGVQACVTGLRSGHTDMSGHDAMRAWASYLVRPEAFRDHFETPTALMDALLDLHRSIEGQGALLRALFADGLGEASQLLRDPVLRAQRSVWADIARDWSDFAGRCVPRDAGLAELQHLGVQIERAVGSGLNPEELGEKRDRLAELRDEAAETWLPSAYELDIEFTRMGHALLELANREEAALDDLADWSGMA